MSKDVMTSSMTQPNVSFQPSLRINYFVYLSIQEKS